MIKKKRAKHTVNKRNIKHILRSEIYLTGLIILVIGVIGIVYQTTSSHLRQDTVTTLRSAIPSIDSPGDHVAEMKDNDIKKSQEKPNEEKTDSAMNSQAPPKPSANPKDSSENTSPSEPFRVTGIYLIQPYVGCLDKDNMYINIDDIMVTANNTRGATVTLRAEKVPHRSWESPNWGDDYFSIKKGEDVGYVDTHSPSYPGPLIIARALLGDKLRVYSTSPNVVYSKWFTITDANSAHCS